MRSNKRIKYHYESEESSFYNKLSAMLSISLFSLTLISALLLSSPIALADDTATDNIEINIPISCNLSLTETTAHTATVNAGTYVNNIGESNVKATCNDSEGFAIYAIGYSGDTYGNNTLINTENSNYTIATGTATSGATSNWAMKLTSVTGTYEPIIVGSTADSEKEQNTPDFSNYTSIPSTYTKVVYRNSATDQSTGANFKTTYAAYVNPTQAAGTYEGKVKYTLVHPSNHIAPIIPAYLDTGQTVNAKMKSLAAGTTIAYDAEDTLIKSIQTADSLPEGFEPTTANTISLPNAENPVYIFFDNTNDAGIMYIYSGIATPIMNPDSSYMFHQFLNLSSAPAISDWDTTNVTDMNRMFYQAGYSASTFSLDLSDWDTSKVTEMYFMFSFAGRSATTWSIGDLSDWDTSKVTNMGSMFPNAGYSATTFSLDLSDWDTSSVTNMSQMFSYAGRSATTWSIGDLSDWDTSKVTNMNNMFSGAGRSATTWSIGDLSDWDTSKVTNMGSMFPNAGYSATTFSLDLSDWDTSSVTNMSQMFSYAGYSASTFSLDLSSWDTSKVTSMLDMFRSAGYSAATWSVIIPQTNGGGISNTTSAMYGKTTSVYAAPLSGKSFTLAQ